MTTTTQRRARRRPRSHVLTWLRPVAHVDHVYSIPTPERRRIHIRLALYTEGFVTLTTRERLLTGVDALVRAQTAGLTEPPATLVAHERLLSAVNAHVYTQTTADTAPVWTFLALERLLTRMGSFVNPQACRYTETPLALIARKRLLTGVDPLVNLQGSVVTKGFYALAALFRLRSLALRWSADDNSRCGHCVVARVDVDLCVESYPLLQKPSIAASSKSHCHKHQYT